MLKTNEHLYSVVLKSGLWLSIGRNTQPLYGFVTSRICFLKNAQSYGMIRSFSIDTIHYTISQISYSLVFLSVGKPSSLQVFFFHQNSWMLEFYHWQQTLSVIFLEVTELICSFSRSCLPSSQVWAPAVCQLFFNTKNGALLGEGSEPQLDISKVTLVLLGLHETDASRGLHLTFIISEYLKCLAMDWRFFLVFIMYVYVMWVQFPKRPGEGGEPPKGVLGRELDPP